MAKSRSYPVEIDGRIVGIIRQRGETSWQFRYRQEGVRKDITLPDVDGREAAYQLARMTWKSGGVAPVPVAPPAPKHVENLGRAIVRFLRQYAKENRNSSLQRVRDSLRCFLNFAGGWRMSVTTLNRKLLIAFRDMRAETCSPATVNSDMQRVKTFVNFCRAEELIEGDPTFKVKKLKTSGIAKEAVSAANVEAAIKAFERKGDCREDWNWLADLCVILANCGLRPSEALHIRACDVDTDSGLLKIRAWEKDGYKWAIKDHENRSLKVNDAALVVLLRRKLATKLEDGLLFPAPMGGPWDYDNFAKIWRKALPKKLRGVVVPYSLRHYFATAAVKAGWPIEKLSRYMGHASIATTQKHYADMRALSETGAPPVLARSKKIAEA